MTLNNPSRPRKKRLERPPARRGGPRRWFESLEPRLVLDSTVVFNEILFNPPGADESLEWIELHNQMAVDMDLSEWSLEGGARFEFPQETTLAGGGYLLVAKDPVAFEAATGIVGALGPFQGQLANGGEALELRSKNDRLMDQVDYNDGGLWPIGPDGSGATLAKIDRDLGSDRADSWTTSDAIGGTPGAENFPDGPHALRPALAINEVGRARDVDFFVELVNFGTDPVDVSQYVLATSDTAAAEYVIPDGPALAPGQYRWFDAATLGLDVAEGERIFFYGPGQTTLVDAARVEARPRGRLPEGTGPWLFSDVPTPGDENSFALRDEIVINEIMFHPREGPAPTPAGAGNDEWIELANRGSQAIDLAGWRLDDGVRFDFAPGTSIAPGEYLVVAKDRASLSARYPAIAGRIVGDFSGSLSNRGERLVLIDAAGNPADEVHYYDDGRWPAATDGGGSSLELRDPRADNRAAESWAASDESHRSVWQTVTYRGIAEEPVGTNNPQGFHELILGLLDAGEVLIDDLSVVEDPGGAALERLQNGSFESDAVGTPPSAWRIVGNHDKSLVVVDPIDPDNQVLRLVATGPTEHMSNHAETTFAGGAVIAVGQQYEISFRAKWISGSNQLNSKLYFNKLARTTLLEVPDESGTPGAANSRLESNIGPTFSDFVHGPLVPSAGEPVTVYAAAADPEGVASMTLWVSPGPPFSLGPSGPWTSTPMQLGADGRYQAIIAGQDAGYTVQFYVEAEDGLGAVSTFPAAGRDSRALYRVARVDVSQEDIQLLRLIMTNEDIEVQKASTNAVSNDRLGSTVIYNDRTVFYDVGVRLRGAAFGRGGARTGFNIRFHPDRLFRGVQRTISIDRGLVLNNGSGNVSGLAGASPHELLFDQIANRAGGIPAQRNDVVFLEAPRFLNTGLSALKLARFGNDYLDSQFENGGAGPLFKYELIYYADSTVDGDPESLKVRPNRVTEIDISDLGSDKEAYRPNFVLTNNRDADDFRRLIDLSRVFSLTGDDLDRQSQAVMDVDQWMRVMALVYLTGVGDTYTMNLNHNLELFVRPSDDKVLLFPWDYDLSFFQSTRSPLLGRRDTNLGKIINLPHNRRLVYGHMLDLIRTSYNTGTLGPWIKNYSQLTDLPDQIPFFETYINNRVDYVLEQLKVVAPTVPFQITTNDGNDLTVDQSTVTLGGTGWIDVYETRLAGTDLPLDVTWTDQEHWEVTLPVVPGGNRFDLEAFDFQGNLVGSDGITVTSTAGDPTAGLLRIRELNYHPYDALPEYGDLDVDDGKFEFVELVNRSDTESIRLEGVSFTDGIAFTFGDTDLGPGDRVLVVRDRAAFESRYGTGLPVAGQYAGKLSNSGETIRLEDRQGNVIVEFTYDDGIPWPTLADGSGASLEVIDTEASYNDPANWRSSNEFGGSPGAEGTGPTIDMVVNEVLGSPSGNGQDQLELVNTTDAPIELAGWFVSDDGSDLLKQRLPEGTVAEAGQYVTLDEPQFGFDLAAGGGQLWLIAADPTTGRPARFANHAEFGAANPGRSLGRWPNADPTATLFPMKRQTFGSANPRPAVGEVMISEVYYHPPGVAFQQDFSAGTAAGFDPKRGVWSVTDGRYDVTPGPEEDTFSQIVPVGELTTDFAVFATVNIPDEAPFQKNAAIIFDYRGPTDFKFAALFVRAGRWRIGQRDASGWNFLAEIPASLNAQVDYSVEVRVVGSAVTLLSGGAARVRYDFGELLRGGEVGLGSKKRGRATFDDVRVVPYADDAKLEFVELASTATGAVALDGWQLTGGMSWTFSGGTSLAPGETVVVVGFDPADPLQANRFRARMGVDDSVRLVGPFSGRLDNDGDIVALARPSEPAGPVLVDRVAYDDGPPWPEAAAGQARSLHRLAPSEFGDFASSWVAGPPTPGTTTFALTGDLNGDTTVDGADTAPFVLGLRSPEIYASIHGVPPVYRGDVDHDGDFDFDDIGPFTDIIGNDEATPATPDAIVLLGDMNGDGKLDLADHGAFAVALRSQTVFEQVYGVPPVLRGDMDQDGDFDFDDTGRFLNRGEPLAAADQPSPRRGPPAADDLAFERVWLEEHDWLDSVRVRPFL